MSAGDPGELTRAERRSAILGPLYRVLGTPVVAFLGLANTAIIVRETGAAVFGLVALIATITLLFPFADLGIGATAMTAAAQLSGPAADLRAADVIRRSYHVLFAVAAAVSLAALAVMAADRWAVLTGFASGPEDRWAITAAAGLFALSIPAGLGVRILAGMNRVPLATLILMSNALFALAITGVLYLLGAPGIWYALSALGGLLIGQIVGTVVALRVTGLGWSAFGAVRGSAPGLLRGTLWLFLTGVGVPVGMQAGRVLLAHFSTPLQLSEYALLAQMYAVGWVAFSTAGFAFWPIFVKRRGEVAATLQIWARMTAVFTGAAVGACVVLVLAAPWAGRILSGGTIPISTALALAFGVLLVAQCSYLATSMLLTRPEEARLQALWALVMALLSVGLGGFGATRFGAAGVVWAAATAVLIAQVIPALLWVPRMVRRRPEATAA
jgi:O-antigen/teichoic acid export membrane protein